MHWDLAYIAIDILCNCSFGIRSRRRIPVNKASQIHCRPLIGINMVTSCSQCYFTES